MAKDVFYFSHDYNARNDPKILRLRSKYGMAGVGIYWSIIEMLYEQGGSMRLQCDGIAFALHEDEARIAAVIQDFDLFEISGETFSSPSAQRRMAARDEKSKKSALAAQKRWSGMRPHSERIANAVPPLCHERKGKERKGNNNNNNVAVPEIFDASHNFGKKEMEAIKAVWNKHPNPADKYMADSHDHRHAMGIVKALEAEQCTCDELVEAIKNYISVLKIPDGERMISHRWTFLEWLLSTNGFCKFIPGRFNIDSYRRTNLTPQEEKEQRRKNVFDSYEHKLKTGG